MEPKPAAGAILPQWAVITLTALVGVASIVLAVGQAGVVLPPWAQAVAGTVVGIGAMFGIMSPGVRRLTEAAAPPANVTTLDQAASELRKGPPAP